jgi:hypothetical protein
MSSFCTNNVNQINDTYIEVPIDTRIISFSDIHADINSLIIALRDCAQVIRKKTGHEFNNLTTYDPELDNILNIILNPNTNNYPDDLNYEWIPNDKTIIVIIGDMIDGKNRVQPIYKNNSRNNSRLEEEHEYPQIEIKILRFINSLNKQAMNNGGRIYKLLGNHEIMNIESIASKYYFDNDKNNNNYFNGISRDKIFNIGNYGFYLLFEDSCRALLMINKYIFVHGQLIKNKNFNYYNDINQKIKTNNNIQSAINELSKITSQLWAREFGSDEIIKKRADLNYQNLQNNKSKTYKEIEYESDFCKNDITEYFNSFLSGSNSIKYTSADLKIVIGHCVQSDNTFFDSPATSLTTIESQDTIRQILTGPAKNSLYNSKDNLIFGITMECPHDHDLNSTKYKINRVDIGSSRMFDQQQVLEHNIKNIEAEKKYLFSRTPQVLEFINDDTKIIKSQIKNTRIHQPRFFYNNIISNIPELQFTNTAYYKQKYIKYKTKYISLKNIK